MRKSHIKIHEDARGGIYVVGLTTRPVNSLQDVSSELFQIFPGILAIVIELSLSGA